MSCTEPKIKLIPTTPEDTLEQLMPMANNGYGTLIRTNKGYQLQRTDTVELDRYGKSSDRVHTVSTMWSLHEMSDDYTRKLLQTLGHFHRAGATLIGFCPNEQLPFASVNKLIALLPVAPEPSPRAPAKPRRAPRQPAA